MPILFELIQNKIFVLNLFMEKTVKIEFNLQEKSNKNDQFRHLIQQAFSLVLGALFCFQFCCNPSSLL